MPKNITKPKHRFPLRQLRKIPILFRRHWPELLLTAITLFLTFLNYEPKTFLIGWDNLNPEFNIWLNLKRALYSVWQEYRGLGLLGGQAHAADLPRLLIILLFQTLKIPLSTIRYLTTFLPLITGPLGVYYLFYHRLFRDKLDAKTTQFASFLGGLFYLLNLSTLQTFFVPFETFTWFYGALPWLLFSLISYIHKPSPGKIVILFAISFLASPSFYVETIFLVFFVNLLPFLIEYFSQKKHFWQSAKIVIAAISVVIIPQLYWLLPVTFFVITGGGSLTANAKINQISSPQTYYRNLEYANLNDVFHLKGYLFQYLDMSGNFQYDYLLSSWRSHLSTPLVSVLGWLFISLIIIGLYYSFKKKFSWTSSFICVVGLSLFFLLGGGLIINEAIPLIGELFRSPFTKFSIPLSLAFSFFFAVGTMFLLDLFTFLHSRLTYILTLFTTTVFLIIYMSPAFSGNLIANQMRQKLPQEYLDLFQFMNQQNPTERIASLPQYTFWGWSYYNWGYRGSGFLWHGLQQPLLDRAFDVWDTNSEKYYQELSTAIYSDNYPEFEEVLDKYAVTWILLDKNIISPDGKTDLKINNLEAFLNHSTKFTLVKNFNNNIYLYKTDLDKKVNNTVSLSPTNHKETIQPFSHISHRPNQNWIEKSTYLSLVSPINFLNQNKASTTLHLPSFTKSEDLIPVKIDYQKVADLINLRLTPVTPILFTDNKQIDIDTTPTIVSLPIPNQESFIIQIDNQYVPLQLPAEIPSVISFFNLTTLYLPTKEVFPISIYSTTDSTFYDLTNELSLANPYQCYTTKPNRKLEKIVSPAGISILGTDVNGCLSAKLPRISPNSLLSYSFIYSSPTLVGGEVNISGEDLISQETNTSLEPSKTPKQATLFTHGSNKPQQINLILTAEDSKSIQEIQYKKIEVGIHPQLFSTTAYLVGIKPQDITLDNIPTKLQISLPLTSTQYDLSQTPLSNSLLPESKNCDQFNSGKTVKIINQSGFLYQSQDAIQCDYLNLKNFTHSLNYLLTVTAVKEKGLTLTTCLENYSTRRCDIFDRLLDSNLSQSIIQPIRNPNEPSGFTLHIINESIGNRITSNLLKSLTIRPIPLSFIENITLTNNNNQDSNSPVEISLSHPNESLYIVTPKDKLDTNLTLNLYQSQSPYWKAFVAPSNSFYSPQWLIPIKVITSYSKLSQLNHQDNSLWYNSWNIDQNHSNQTIIIFYIPQYLEFIGIAIAATTVLLYLTVIAITKRSP